MLVEFGQWRIEVGASLREMVKKRVEEIKKKRKSESMKEGVRRRYFQEGGAPDAVFNFGK